MAPILASAVLWRHVRLGGGLVKTVRMATARRTRCFIALPLMPFVEDAGEPVFTVVFGFECAHGFRIGHACNRDAHAGLDAVND